VKKIITIITLICTGCIFFTGCNKYEKSVNPNYLSKENPTAENNLREINVKAYQFDDGSVLALCTNNNSKDVMLKVTAYNKAYNDMKKLTGFNILYGDAVEEKLSSKVHYKTYTNEYLKAGSSCAYMFDKDSLEDISCILISTNDVNKKDASNEIEWSKPSRYISDKTFNITISNKSFSIINIQTLLIVTNGNGKIVDYQYSDAPISRGDLELSAKYDGGSDNYFTFFLNTSYK
jgi:hypothetical protein